MIRASAALRTVPAAVRDLPWWRVIYSSKPSLRAALQEDKAAAQARLLREEGLDLAQPVVRKLTTVEEYCAFEVPAARRKAMAPPPALAPRVAKLEFDGTALHVPNFLTTRECVRLLDALKEPKAWDRTVHLDSRNLGRGAYRYLAEPLAPPGLQELRRLLYAKLLPAAREAAKP